MHAHSRSVGRRATASARFVSLTLLAALVGRQPASAADLPADLAALGPLLDPATVVAAAAGVDTNRYPDADDVLVDDIVRQRYEADGTAVGVDDEYFKILTEKGRRDHLIRPFHFMLPYDTVTVVRAEIFKPDGRCVPIDVARFGRIVTESGQMSMNIFDPNNKILQVSLPGLEVGDLCHFTSIRRTRKARVPNTWADFTVFEYSSPIHALTYEVSAPRDRPLRHARLREPAGRTVEATTLDQPDGRTRHRWQVRNVAQVFPEPNMPPLHTVVQRLLLSTSADWPSISRWYWELCQPRLEAVTPEMRATVSNLVATTHTRDDRVRRVFAWVSQNVRYMGITTETEAPGYEPHDVSVTFHNRYGVCRDKAALLVAMLRLAGLEAYPVLIHAGAKMDPEVPVPFFNHAIVAVTQPGGGYELMDPTNENTRDLLPAYLCNRSYLVAHPRGETLAVSAVPPAERNLVKIRSRGRIDGSGTLLLDTQVDFDGINDTLYRGHLVGLKPEERRRFFEGLVKQRLAGAELLRFELNPADLRDTEQPLAATLSSRLRDYPTRGDGIDGINLPWLASSVGYVNFVLGRTGLRTRRFTLETEVACGVEEQLELQFTEALGAPRVLPEPQLLDRVGVHYQRTLAATNGTLLAGLRFLLRQPEYGAAEYPELKNVLREIEYAARQRPLFEPGGARQPDLRVLTDNLRVELDSAHAWTTTHTWSKQILTYAGKKRHSELKLEYNPAWEQLELVSAVVSNGNGAVHRVQPAECNVMDAPWVGGAPRYPPARTLVVSLPGVETGSVISVATRSVRREAPFFALQYSFRGFEPVDQTELTLLVPSGLQMRMRPPAPPVRFTKRTNKGQHALRWTATDQAALAAEDALPPRWTLAPTLFASCGEWDAYASQVRRAFQRAATPRAQAERRARELVRGVASPAERLRRVRDAVVLGVRPAGPSFTELPLTFTPPDTTLADGYGHAADRALLLATMLRAVGFESEPVLAHSGNLTGALLLPLTDLPQPGLFDTVLVAVRGSPTGWGLGSRPALAPGQPPESPILLNDSDQYAEPGTCALFRHPTLSLRGRLGSVSVMPAYAPRRQADWTITVAENGDATLTVTNWFHGSACTDFRRQYAELPPEERSRDFQELVGRVSQAAEPVGELVTDLDAYPGLLTFTVRAPRYAVRAGNTLTVQLPEAGAPVVGLRADLRVAPLHVPDFDDAIWRCRVVLPPQTLRVAMAPPDAAWDLPAGLGRLDATTTQGRLADGSGCSEVRIERVLRIEPTVVPPELYPALLEMNRRLQHPQMRSVLAELAAP